MVFVTNNLVVDLIGGSVHCGGNLGRPGLLIQTILEGAASGFTFSNQCLIAAIIRQIFLRFGCSDRRICLLDFYRNGLLCLKTVIVFVTNNLVVDLIDASVLCLGNFSTPCTIFTQLVLHGAVTNSNRTCINQFLCHTCIGQGLSCRCGDCVAGNISRNNFKRRSFRITSVVTLKGYCYCSCANINIVLVAYFVVSILNQSITVQRNNHRSDCFSSVGILFFQVDHCILSIDFFG